MRVALTHAHCWPEVRRGGERYLHELAGALSRRGHNVTVFGGATTSGVLDEDGVRVVRIARGGAVDPGAEQRFAARLFPRLVTGRFDVVHSLGPHDAVASLRARRVHRRRRTVYTNLGNPVREWWESLPSNDAHERIVSEVDVYGCLSRYGLEALRSDYGREGTLTPGGVRLDTFRPAGAREPGPTLLYSGALDDERKGVAVLLEAIALMTAGGAPVALWLSGSGDASAILDGAPPSARERTVVLPLGRTDEQPGRYSAAWATVLPSLGEAFGLALLESLACGTPIVGVDHASIPEMVRPGIGVLAPARDPHALADACRASLELSSDPGIAHRCRDAARAYDWDSVVAPAIERAYQSDEAASV